MGIVVITHNGKLPKDGGKRWGYRYGNKIFILGVGEMTVAQFNNAVKKSSGLPVYEKFPELDYDQECHFCNRWRFTAVPTMTDQGKKTLYRCQCGDELMRANPDSPHRVMLLLA